MPKSNHTDVLSGALVLLHGAPKSGKTTTASSFPEPVLFVTTEGGHRYLPEAQQKRMLSLRFGPMKVKRKAYINGWDVLMTYVDDGWLATQKIRTVVIDTIGNLYLMCMEYVCKKQNVTHPSEGSHGLVWNAVEREFIRGLLSVVRACEDDGRYCVLIAHSRTETIKAGSTEYNQIVADLTGQARKVIVPAPDHIWYLGYDTNEEDSTFAFDNNRCLWMQPTQFVEAGSRDRLQELSCIRPLNKTRQFKQILSELTKHRATKES